MGYLGIELDRLPKGISYNCNNCKEAFTIHREPPFVIYPVEEESFEEGFICHCGQHYHIKNRGKHA